VVSLINHFTVLPRSAYDTTCPTPTKQVLTMRFRSTIGQTLAC
jgi:hypothetical protein